MGTDSCVCEPLIAILIHPYPFTFTSPLRRLAARSGAALRRCRGALAPALPWQR